MNHPRIAVIIPAYNEELTIRNVVRGFANTLPGAQIYVYDNNSRDLTAQYAQEAGALVRTETRQGKGHAVRRAFADIEADIYLLVDGDDTYDAMAARTMVDKLVDERLDYVNGARVHQNKEAYRPGHTLGNKVLTNTVGILFGRQTTDMLSGYKVLSRRFVKSFPLLSVGFELETELMVHALELAMPIGEVKTHYKERPSGSTSKLNTYRDGWRILWTILKLFKDERPLFFFGIITGLLVMLSMAIGVPIIVNFLETGLVPRFPSAILAGLIGVISIFSLTCGLILDLTRKARHDTKRLFYLSIPLFQRQPD
ncbi:glycosyltransferase family 2 protein [Silvimonas amylolytica]|uniref:Glycosyl transferase n=1 Tax=Silvimonas amylolytica TaxID=449663 RepID=A0ABQ2PJY9_9NEIS|nr:glycosyltransferase family 2 protein [Silvimonas amylolytica]GGP25536.1 glycosyl transferase [Silvimonas amylolytica]